MHCLLFSGFNRKENYERDSVIIRLLYLFSDFHRYYTTNRHYLVENAKGKSKVHHLLGDGKCNSPGFNAKYGTYTLIDIWVYPRLPYFACGTHWQFKKNGIGWIQKD